MPDNEPHKIKPCTSALFESAVHELTMRVLNAVDKTIEHAVQNNTCPHCGGATHPEAMYVIDMEATMVNSKFTTSWIIGCARCVADVIELRKAQLCQGS
jgi:hypothetical protein